jgi:predicted ABC-class ATPase
MSDLQGLASNLKQIHRQNYKRYKEIKGQYQGNGFRFQIDHVQGDPYADFSKGRVFLNPKDHNLPESVFRSTERQLACRDYLTRVFARLSRQKSRQVGTGKGGLLHIDAPGQAVLDKSSCLLHQDRTLELRFEFGLPAQGRRILGHEAASQLTQTLPQVIDQSLRWENLDSQDLETHMATVEDAEAMRRQLVDKQLVAFIGNQSVLPRLSGVSDRPLNEGAIPFESPPSLQVQLDRPNAGPIEGMGIPKGITLVVGGGYHGKSTLLRAIEKSIYPHIPGDGRETVVSHRQSVKIRAEDGRSVKGVDISPFIKELPQGRATDFFSSDNASGSTSQATNIIEAVEIGADLLLLDEDTSASNFMIRDERMQRLIAPEREPITPLIDRIGEIYQTQGLSAVLVMGASGDFFEIAHTVIGLHHYRCQDLTDEAKRIVAQYPSGRLREPQESFPATLRPRWLEASQLSARHRGKDVYIKTRDCDQIQFGSQTIDLAAVEQLCHPSQLRAISHALLWIRAQFQGQNISVKEAIDRCYNYIQDHGLAALDERPNGSIAEIRPWELATALNRLRNLAISPDA